MLKVVVICDSIGVSAKYHCFHETLQCTAEQLSMITSHHGFRPIEILTASWERSLCFHPRTFSNSDEHFNHSTAGKPLPISETYQT